MMIDFIRRNTLRYCALHGVLDQTANVKGVS
jgi:hypothetical protein